MSLTRLIKRTQHRLGPRWMRWLTLGFVAYALGITAGRALRWPNDWAQIHWLVTYRFGFRKRALPGELLRQVGAYDTSEAAVTIINGLSALLLAVLLLLLLFICVRVLRLSRYSENGLIVCLLIATSTYVLYSAHLIGYYDHLFQITAIVAVYAVLRGRWWLAGLLQLPIILVHESYLLVGYPVVVLALWLQHRAAKARRGMVLVVAGPLVMFAALFGLQQAFPPGNTAELAASLQRYDFVLQSNVAEVLQNIDRSFLAFLGEQAPYFALRLLSVPPGVLAFVVAGLYIMSRFGDPSRLSSPVRLAALTAVFVPVALHAIAYDTPRIWVYVGFHMLLVLWMLLETEYVVIGDDGPSLALMLLLVLLVTGSPQQFFFLNPVDDKLYTTRLLLAGHGLFGLGLLALGSVRALVAGLLSGRPATEDQ